MDETWDYKVVKAPMNNPKARQRVLNREAKDGWEIVETTRGPLLSPKDQVTLRRARGYKAAQRAEAAAAEAAAAEAVKSPEQRAAEQRSQWVAAGVVALLGLAFIVFLALQ